MTKYFLNREISWLQFNARVLQEAADQSNPLIERLKFLGIFSNNRDEFFRVRVATMKRLLRIEKKEHVDSGFAPGTTLKKISEIVAEQEVDFTNIYQEIRELLEKENIHIIDEHKLTDEQGFYIRKYFLEEVRPYVFPIMLDSNKNPLNVLKDADLNLLVTLNDSKNPEREDTAVIKVPTDNFSRFLVLPSRDEHIVIIMLDDVIRYCLNDIFGFLGYDTLNAYTIKFTRDAELDIDHDVSRSFLDTMRDSVLKRKKGLPVRFVYDKEIPEKTLKTLMKRLRITDKDSLRGGGRYHNFKDFMAFPRIPKPHLYFQKTPPLPHPDMLTNRSMFALLQEKDIMLHYPYQSFTHIIDLLREASIDPKVRSIKMTFYRAAHDSNVINALINAARNGKKITVFLEIQARFDEEANIYWTNRLQEEGVKIIETIPGFKVHAKLLVIRRKEEGNNVYYANISTGNFNESTAHIYADDSLITANQSIAEDVDKLFTLFESRYTIPNFNSLIVAPFDIRNHFIDLINNEIQAAKEGCTAKITIKLNSLVDRQIIHKLYEASQANVHIKLIIRGICVLKPGVPGLSENIHAISIVDKFLEHSRVFVFENKGKPLYFISSADWMPRNFDHRIEISCPIYDKEIQQELDHMLRIQWSDTSKARILDAKQRNKYKKPDPSSEEVRSQFHTYKYFLSGLNELLNQ